MAARKLTEVNCSMNGRRIPFNCGGKATEGSTNSRPLQGRVLFNRVLTKIRGCGRLRAAPTGAGEAKGASHWGVISASK